MPLSPLSRLPRFRPSTVTLQRYQVLPAVVPQASFCGRPPTLCARQLWLGIWQLRQVLCGRCDLALAAAPACIHVCVAGLLLILGSCRLLPPWIDQLRCGKLRLGFAPRKQQLQVQALYTWKA
jgi:hypothetical protein